MSVRAENPEEADYSDELLQERSDAAQTLSDEGEYRLLPGLLLEFSQPQFFHWFPPIARPREAWSPIAVTPPGGVQPRRPSNEDVMTWQAGLEASCPPEWTQWVLDRYNAQRK